MLSQFTHGEPSLQERVQILAHALGVPERPFGVVAIGLDEGLMMGFASCEQELAQGLCRIRFHGAEWAEVSGVTKQRASR